MSEQQYKYIVRIAETDIPGDLKVPYGLSLIKGIGINMAYAICRLLGIDPNKRIGFLTDQEIAKIEQAIKNPKAIGIPSWMLNRRRDYETGQDMHLVGAQLIYYVRRDIEREKRIKSWRGIRHALGLKVRGQKTSRTGRTGMTVGVKRRR